MIRNFKFFILLLCCFISATPVYAAECTNEELDYLVALAKKVKIVYEFNESVEGHHGFNIKGYNLSDKFYVRLPNGMDFLPKNSQEDFGRYLQDTDLSFEIFASHNTNCAYEPLANVEAEMPIFNEYSKREECLKNKDIDVCKEWYDASDITEEEFKDIIDKANQTVVVDEENKFVAFLKNNLMYIILGVVVVSAILTVRIIVKNKRRIKIDI